MRRTRWPLPIALALTACIGYWALRPQAPQNEGSFRTRSASRSRSLEPTLAGRVAFPSKATRAETQAVVAGPRVDSEAPSAVGHLRGRVLCEDVPVVGATIHLYAVNAGLPLLVVRGTTDEGGWVELDLGNLRAWSKNRLHTTTLAAYVFAKGCYMPRGLPVLVETLLNDVLELRPEVFTSTLRKGRVLRGRLGFEDGELAYPAFASIALPGKGKAGEPYYTAPDGRFAVPLVSRGGSTRVIAGAPACETVEGKYHVELSPHDAVIHDVIVIPRPPVMTGVVRFADGSPVANLRLVFSPWRDPDVRTPAWSPDDDLVVSRTNSDGQFSGFVPAWGARKGDAASFMLELPGLDSEEDVVWAGFDASERKQVIKIKHHRLIVTCVDQHREPIANLQIMVNSDGIGDITTDERGTISWFLHREDKRALIQIVGAGNLPIQRRVEIPPDRNTLEVTIIVPDATEIGTVDVRFEPKPNEKERPVWVIVRDETAGMDVFWAYGDRAPDSINLQPGSYRVRVQGPRWRRFGSKTPGASASYEFFHVKVEANRTTDLDVAWTKTSGIAALFRDARNLSLGHDIDVLDVHGKGHFVSFVDQRGRDVSSHEPIRSESWIFAEEFIEPGDYTLVWKHEGYEPIRRNVRLYANELTRVELSPVPIK